MKLFCFFTPSHQVLYDQWFRPTLRDNWDLVVVRSQHQWCDSAEWRTKGWRQTQTEKVRVWLQACRSEAIFVGADVDIQWFGVTETTLLAYLGERDIAVETYGNGTICSGFFICRGNKRTRNLWQTVLSKLEANKCQGEQELLQNGLNRNLARWAELPYEQFWSPRRRYRSLTELQIPNNILMHHATYTVGIPNKTEQLRHVRTHVCGLSVNS